MRRGLSLLEVVFAIAALAFFFFALISLYPTVILSMHQSEHRMAANSCAQEALDHCSAASFGTLVPGTYTPAAPGPLALFLTNVTLGDQTVLMPEVVIVQGPNPGIQDKLRMLTVNVSWKERNKTITVSRHRRIAKLLR